MALVAHAEVDGMPPRLPTAEELGLTPALMHTAREGLAAAAGIAAAVPEPRPALTRLAGVVHNALTKSHVENADLTAINEVVADAVQAKPNEAVGAASTRAAPAAPADRVRSVGADLTMLELQGEADGFRLWRYLAASNNSTGSGLGPRFAKDATSLPRVTWRDENAGHLVWVLDAEGPALEPPTSWALVSHDAGEDLYACPYHGRTGAADLGRPSVSMEIHFDRWPGPRRSRTTAVVHDPVLGGLLSYLQGGNLAPSRALIRRLAEQNIIEACTRKESPNPLAACAAVYAGLATLEADERPSWLGRLSNLANSFPWLPDGAVVLAMQKLLFAAALEADNAEFRNILKTAFDRGVPYYTLGVMRLRDGLAMLPKDPEAKAMHAAVCSLSRRLDPVQVFTTLRYRPGEFAGVRQPKVPVSAAPLRVLGPWRGKRRRRFSIRLLGCRRPWAQRSLQMALRSVPGRRTRRMSILLIARALMPPRPLVRDGFPVTLIALPRWVTAHGPASCQMPAMVTNTSSGCVAMVIPGSSGIPMLVNSACSHPFRTAPASCARRIPIRGVPWPGKRQIAETSSSISCTSARSGQWTTKGRTSARATADSSDVIEMLPYLRALGFTAVQFLPVQEYDRDYGLGYNNLDYFSPEMAYQVEGLAEINRHLGKINGLLTALNQSPLAAADILTGPNQLKCLVDVCHLHGLAVIFDQVYNHAGGGFGDRSLAFYDRQVDDGTPWDRNKATLYFGNGDHAGGLVFNYEKDPVRQLLIDNARFFLDEGPDRRYPLRSGRCRHDAYRRPALLSRPDRYAAVSSSLDHVYRHTGNGIARAQ